LILHTPPKANAAVRQEGGWSARSLASVANPDDLDLRRPDHSRRLEAVLATMSLD
jgi:hypothetical protein